MLTTGTSSSTLPTFSVLRASASQRLAHGPMRLTRIRPGQQLGFSDDPGFGALGTIDHARLSPGLLVPMHEHRNDEIVSYLRRGALLHEDTGGNRAELNASHVTVMNSGKGFSHEEAIPLAASPVEMLQIFIRPFARDLPPEFQHVTAPPPDPTGERWRLLVGPGDANAPAYVRNSVWIRDAQLPAGGASTSLCIQPHHDLWLYVFSGQIAVGSGETLSTGDSLRALGATHVNIQAITPAELVAIEVDRSSPFTRSGSLSG